MLVLSRLRDETIMIGDDVEITVVDIRGDKVRLGIAAPRSVQVHRKEVYDSIKREMTDAALVRVEDLRAAEEDMRGRSLGNTPATTPGLNGSHTQTPAPTRATSRGPHHRAIKEDCR